MLLDHALLHPPACASFNSSRIRLATGHAHKQPRAVYGAGTAQENAGHIRCEASGQAEADGSALAGNATRVGDDACRTSYGLTSTPSTASNNNSPNLAIGSSFATTHKLLDLVTSQQQETLSKGGLLQQMTQALLFAQQLVQDGDLQGQSDSSHGSVFGSGLLGPAGATNTSLQAELTATRMKLSTALAALDQLQSAHRLQREAIAHLQHQLHEHTRQQCQTERAGQPPALAVPISQAGAAALAIAAGAGAASLHMHKQQQQLQAQLAEVMQERQMLVQELEAANGQLLVLTNKVREHADVNPTLSATTAATDQECQELLCKEISGLKQQLQQAQAKSEEASAVQQELLRQQQTEIESLVHALCMLWQATSPDEGVSATQEQSGTKVEQCRSDHMDRAGPASGVPVAALRYALLHTLLQQLSGRVGEKARHEHQPKRWEQLQAHWALSRELLRQPSLLADTAQPKQMCIVQDTGRHEVQGQQQLMLQMQSSMNSAVQLLQHYVTDLQKSGSWALPTSAGLVDTSQLQVLPECSKVSQQTINEHTSRESCHLTPGKKSEAYGRTGSAAGHGCLTSSAGVPAGQQDAHELQVMNLFLLNGASLSRADATGNRNTLLNTEGSAAVGCTAAQACAKAYLQLPERDQALHCLATQLLAIQGQLAELHHSISAGHKSWDHEWPMLTATSATREQQQQQQQAHSADIMGQTSASLQLNTRSDGELLIVSTERPPLEVAAEEMQKQGPTTASIHQGVHWAQELEQKLSEQNKERQQNSTGLSHNSALVDEQPLLGKSTAFDGAGNASEEVYSSYGQQVVDAGAAVQSVDNGSSGVNSGGAGGAGSSSQGKGPSDVNPVNINIAHNSAEMVYINIAPTSNSRNTSNACSASHRPDDQSASALDCRSNSGTAAVEPPTVTAWAAAAVAIRPPVSVCGQLQLLGSNLGVAVLGPIVQQLMHAQQHELAVKAAQAKICQVLGLIAVTDVAIQRAQGEAEVLQQHLQEVEHWRALLVLICQLTKAEQGLKESLGLLQAVEQQAGQEPPAQQHRGKDDVVFALKDVVTVTDGCLACAADDVVACAADHHGSANVDQSTLSAEHGRFMSKLVALPDGSALQVLRQKACRLLQQLAERQSELLLVRCYVGRLAAVLMAGSRGTEIAELQQQLQRQLQQVNRSRSGIQQQLAQITGGSEGQGDDKCGCLTSDH